MTIEQGLNILVEAENKAELDNIRLSGIPVWNILKYDIRRQYLVKKGICESVQSVKSKLVLRKSLAGMWQSFVRLHKIIIHPSKVDNLVMGFSRLDNIEGEFLDRFIDPIVEMTNLKKSYICFEYGKTGIHQSPRRNIEKTIYTDYAYFLSFFWGIIFAIPYLAFHFRQIVSTCKLIERATDLKIRRIYLSRKIVEFYCNVSIFSLIIYRIQAKRVFGVSRILFRHVSFAAKKRGLPVYELQHGITLGSTELYSGNYNPEIDPDYFLLFGESCPRGVFGIPESKTINVGWAFKHYLENISIGDHQEKSCLVISEPQISNQIIDATLLLARKNPHIQFHIRRHPQELFTKEQKSRFSRIDNVIDGTNKRNSMLVVMEYDFIIGENSTVLFEGLSLGKKIARLNICGLHPTNRLENDAFYYIDKIEDFDTYLNGPVKVSKEKVYSDFDTNLFNSFLN